MGENSFFRRNLHLPDSFVSARGSGADPGSAGAINGWLQQLGAVEKYARRTRQTRVHNEIEG